MHQFLLESLLESFFWAIFLILENFASLGKTHENNKMMKSDS
jgi:hypothetical protein